MASAASMDKLDRDLTGLLIRNARESVADLARQLGVARTTVISRMRRLERDGRILGYTARLGRGLGDARIQAYVGISVHPKAGRQVVRQLARFPEVRQLSAVSGESDYIAFVAAETTARLDELLDVIGELDGVSRTSTSVVLAQKLQRPTGDASPDSEP
jgi:DNA-binding Lrp family transcriptional regulator